VIIYIPSHNMHAPTKTKNQLQMQEPCDCDILTAHIACERYPFVLGFILLSVRKYKEHQDYFPPL
jgi:hypothetical protein